jgi:hypothetical protein
VPGFGANLLHQNVVADRAYKGAKPLRVLDTALSHNLQDAEQCFLANIFNQLRRADSDSQLQGEQVTEIEAEVAFDSGVAARQPLKIILVE